MGQVARPTVSLIMRHRIECLMIGETASGSMRRDRGFLSEGEPGVDSEPTEPLLCRACVTTSAQLSALTPAESRFRSLPPTDEHRRNRQPESFIR